MSSLYIILCLELQYSIFFLLCTVYSCVHFIVRIAITLSRSIFIAVLSRFVVLLLFYLYHSSFLTSAKNAFAPRSVCCAQMENKLL